MDDADRATIMRQLPNLLQAVQLTPELRSQLLRWRVFPPSGLDELESEPSPLERRRRLLIDATRRGPRAFDGLVRALAESGQLVAARLLRPTLSLADLVPAAAGVMPTTLAHQPLPVVCDPPAVRPAPADGAIAAQPPPPRKRLAVRAAERRLGTLDDTYRMESEPRGLALVISNTEFRQSDVHPHRTGGVVDEAALHDLLQSLGFRVELVRNLTCTDMLTAVKTFAKRDEHTQHDAMVLAVMTHGKDGALFGIDSRPLATEEVIGCFSHTSAPFLDGKPKWLIFQACRGSELNLAHRVRDPARQQNDGRAQVPMTRPECGDIFITYSTIPGHVSMRDMDTGTWLVEILCEVFAEWARCLDIGELHTKVQSRMNDIVTVKNEKQTMETLQRGWRKKMYFNPGLSSAVQ